MIVGRFCDQTARLNLSDILGKVEAYSAWYSFENAYTEIR